MGQASLSSIQALIIAIWVALVESRALGYSTLNLRFSPLMTGLVVGIVMGDVSTAMTITASIQLIYMGMIAPGGAMPSEPAVATAIAVPVAILAGLQPTEAIAVAVPVGLLGSYLYQFRFFLNTFIVRLTDKYAAELNDKGLNSFYYNSTYNCKFRIICTCNVYRTILWGACNCRLYSFAFRRQDIPYIRCGWRRPCSSRYCTYTTSNRKNKISCILPFSVFYSSNVKTSWNQYCNICNRRSHNSISLYFSY